MDYVYQHYPLAMLRGEEYAEAQNEEHEKQMRSEGFRMFSEPEESTESEAPKKRGRPKKED